MNENFEPTTRALNPEAGPSTEEGGAVGKSPSESENESVRPTRKRRATPLVWVIAISWLAAVATAGAALFRYESVPAQRDSPPEVWPSTSLIRRTPGRDTLLLFAHPRCPCTRATIGELEKLVTHTRNPANVRVVFFRPASYPHEWAKTPLWRSAEAIPGVTVIDDGGRIESSRFGVRTSGSALLYDASGTLRFNGGITSARGHSGDNPGRSSIVSFLNHGTAGISETSVFGCSLVEKIDLAKSLR